MRRAHAAFGREWSGAPPGAAREWSRARRASRPFQSSQKNGTPGEDAGAWSAAVIERNGDARAARPPETLHGCGKAYAQMARSLVAEVAPWVTGREVARVGGRGSRLPRDGLQNPLMTSGPSGGEPCHSSARVREVGVQSAGSLRSMFGGLNSG